MSDESGGLIERAAALARQLRSSRPESSAGGDRPRAHNASGQLVVRETGAVHELAGALPFVEIRDSPPLKEIGIGAAMRRHWRLIVAFAGAGTLAAYVASQTVTPLYTATATVMIDPHEAQQRAVGADSTAALSPEEEESVRRNQISLIRSRQLVEAVVAKLGLADNAEFNPWLRPASPVQPAIDRIERFLLDAANTVGLTWNNPGGATKPTAQRVLDKSVALFLDRLKTIAPEASRIIQIDFSSQDPARAAGVANAVAERFIRDQVAEQVARTHSAMQALQKQIDALNLEIRDSEGEIEKLRRRKGLLPDSDLKVIASQMEALDRALADAEVAKVAADHEPLWTLNREANITRAAARVAALQNRVAAAKAEMARASAAEVDVDVFGRQISARRTLMEQLVARLDRTAAQIDAITSDVRLISRATAPEKPSFPPKLAVVASAFLFALIGGTILAVLLERRDRSIRSAAQLRQLSGAPCLGAVPTLKRIGMFRRSPIAQVSAEPRSMFAENLRAIWFQIGHSVRPGATTLVITSALSGEGKTSIAISLARMLALGGRNVVVLDADLRYPKVHKALGFKRGPGLADLLDGSLEIEHALQQDAASGAFCMTAGAAVRSPADLLQSPRTPEVLRYLSARFEAVIVDTPPVLAVHDAAIVAQHADITVMAVRWGATKEETFTTAVQRLHDLDILVDGVILTRVNLRKYARYGAPDEDAFARGLRKYYAR
jgi:capsular exopolysaccharide synthesis family protein